MHSLHHSRARVLFEVACAFGISASCAWAWQQTYATAMLPAAAIAALYGLVHAFDLVRHSPAASESVAAVEPDVPGAVAPASAQVFIRLTSGERIAAGTFDGADPAEGRAKELMRALDADADWPCIDGRYIRPDAVVSIDVELTTI